MFNVNTRGKHYAKVKFVADTNSFLEPQIPQYLILLSTDSTFEGRLPYRFEAACLQTPIMHPRPTPNAHGKFLHQYASGRNPSNMTSFARSILREKRSGVYC